MSESDNVQVENFSVGVGNSDNVQVVPVTQDGHTD